MHGVSLFEKSEAHIHNGLCWIAFRSRPTPDGEFQLVAAVVCKPAGAQQLQRELAELFAEPWTGR
jgi:hypothetical protein